MVIGPTGLLLLLLTWKFLTWRNQSIPPTPTGITALHKILFPFSLHYCSICTSGSQSVLSWVSGCTSIGGTVAPTSMGYDCHTAVTYLGYCKSQCDDPDGYDELDSPAELWDRVSQKWVTYGDVSLDSEGRYRQHSRVRRRLRRQSPQKAKSFAEHVGVPANKQQFRYVGNAPKSTFGQINEASQLQSWT